MKRKLDEGGRVILVELDPPRNADIGGFLRSARALYDAGADAITLGNHSFSKREITPFLDESDRIVRPANYAPQVPGKGWTVLETRFGDVALIDLIGRCGMDYGPDNPFLMIEKILRQVEARFILVEIHAEATSEKLAMGYLLDGRVSAVWGTHTHVPTADARVLPKGTGYVTDLGMTGPRDSVLGIQPELSIAKFRGDLPERYRWAGGPAKLEGVLFTLDSQTGKCLRAERVDQWD